MGLFNKSKDQSSLSKPISTTYFTGFHMPGLFAMIGILIVIVACVIWLKFSMDPTNSTRKMLNELSYPYTIVSVVDSNTVLVKNHWGKEEELELTNIQETVYYNRELNEVFEGKEVWYNGGILYYIEVDETTGKGEAYTVNGYIHQIEQRSEEAYGPQSSTEPTA